MKHLNILAGVMAVAASALGANAAQAQNYGPPPGPPPYHHYPVGPEPRPPFHPPYYHPPYYHPPYYHPPYSHPPGVWGGWHRGDRFYGNRYIIHNYDWGRYHLRPAPYGYEWVQDRGQFVLIGIDTGIVADIFVQ